LSGHSQGPPSRAAAELLPGLLPPTVRTCERREDPPRLALHPEELPYVVGAVPARRREFATVRMCARAALGEYGLSAVALPPAKDRSPRWPQGFVGSMTHCAGFRGAAVARTADVLAVGIDAEPDLPLPLDLHAMIASPGELASLRLLTSAGNGQPACWARLLFSCKESVFKAWYPSTKRWLNFTDAEVLIDAVKRKFTARLLVSDPSTGGPQLSHFSGNWTASDGLLVTATVVPTPPPVPTTSPNLG
jgi:4'-phosphopantetheinyl transferase EntD